MRTYTHPQIAKLLGVSAPTTYRWWPGTVGGLVKEEAILKALNANRMNGQPRLTRLPEQMYRKDTLAEWLTRNTARRRTAAAVNEWIKHGAPHFKLNRAVILDLASMDDWMDRQRNPFRRSTLRASGED